MDDIDDIEEKISSLHDQIERMKLKLNGKNHMADELSDIAESFSNSLNINAANSALKEKERTEIIVTDLKLRIEQNDANYKQLLIQRDKQKKTAHRNIHG